MSDNVPFELQMEIVQRIPDTKSVIRCRSVSKAWKSGIDSKDFVTAHTLQANRHHLLIREQDLLGDKQVTYVSIFDDDTFPPQMLNVFVPDSIDKLFSPPSIIGSSHGLFCLFVSKPETAVIWNPSIRKTIAIAVPNVFSKPHLSTVVGFGVCPRNLDPKLVKITFVSAFSELLDDVDTRTQVEVSTLSSGGTWRSPLSGNVPHNLIGFGDSQAVVDGFIYWNAFDSVDDGSRNVIMSFDLTSEEFTNVNLPDPLAHSDADLAVSNVRDSLAVMEFEWTEILHVWQMIGHGCTRSFNKLYFINGPEASIHTIFGFRKNGAPIVDMEIDDKDYDHAFKALAIYEPESKSINNIGIHELDSSFSVHSYIETLLLLDH